MGSQLKLDTTRPHAIYGEVVNNLPGRYFQQDGHLFDMRTHEFVRDLGEAPTSPSPLTEFGPIRTQAKPTDGTTIACAQCDKVYKLGTTAQTRALALSRMRKHLETKHGITVPTAGGDS